MMYGVAKVSLVAVFFCCPGCCFDLVSLRQVPAQLEMDGLSKPTWILDHDVDIPLETWSSTHLKKATRWEYAGRIKEGDVYKTKDQIVTVEASNVFEAYLVESGGRVVGFYLPVEKTYSPLGRSVAIEMRQVQ